MIFVSQFLVLPICQTDLWILTHWGRVTHICVSRLTITGSDNGLSPGRRQAIIWTNAGILLIGTLETNFNEILIEIHTVSFKKMRLKMSSGKWRPFCLGLNVLIASYGISMFPCYDQSLVDMRQCWGSTKFVEGKFQVTLKKLEAVSIQRCRRIGISMAKIRRSRDRLTFNMGIPIPGKTVFILRRPGGRLNIQTLSYQYRDLHVKDKTVSRPPYL